MARHSLDRLEYATGHPALCEAAGPLVIVEGIVNRVGKNTEKDSDDGVAPVSALHSLL